jgi:uncharacterized protein YgiM (DUF1202 family)
MGLFDGIAQAAAASTQQSYVDIVTASGVNVPDLKVANDNGVISVSGTVADFESGVKVIAALKGAEGVTEVKNYLEIEDLTAKNIFMLVATESSNLNIRSGPGKEYDIVGKAAHNAKVQLIKKMFNGWYYIKDTDGQEGFCSTDYLKEVTA